MAQGASISMWGPQCLNFNVGGLNASNFNVGASISMWEGGGGRLNFNVWASILMWGPQCLNFNVGASMPQIQREASISMWKEPPKMLLVKMRGTEVEQLLLKHQAQCWCRTKPLVWQGISLPELTPNADSYSTCTAPVCYRIHQHLHAR